MSKHKILMSHRPQLSRVYLEACIDITGIHSPIVIMYIHSNVAKFVLWY